MKKYLLSNDVAEMQRLQNQVRVWESAASEFLASLNIRPGSKAIDMGCGAMGVLAPLSRLVGTSGEVIGLDRDASLLDAARAFVQEERLSNISFVEASAFTTGLPSDHFDLVHARFLLAPVGQPKKLIKEMLRIVRPGGIIALQEPDASCWNVSPENLAWSALKEAIFAAFRAGGGDFDVGRRTFGLLLSHGVRDVTQRNAVLAITGNDSYKSLPLQFASSLRERILAGGKFDSANLDACLKQVRAVVDDPASVMTTFIVTQVAGRRRENGLACP